MQRLYNSSLAVCTTMMAVNKFYSRGFTSGAYNGYLKISLKASSFWRKSKSFPIITLEGLLLT